LDGDRNGLRGTVDHDDFLLVRAGVRVGSLQREGRERHTAKTSKHEHELSQTNHRESLLAQFCRLPLAIRGRRPSAQAKLGSVLWPVNSETLDRDRDHDLITIDHNSRRRRPTRDERARP
jgi:hypothetical protein